jgi:aminoglycoside 6-adenylyltransferase
MRSEQAMLALILSTAQNDERIRAVILTGSRANPNVRRDIFQDFDVTYLVTEVDSFKHDPAWIKRFGELMILQMPEAMNDPPPLQDGHFAYLMQFTDGNRIDLTLFPLVKLHEYKRESLSLLLLDKDGIIGPLPPPSESDFLPTPPTDKAFQDCCNEFWWVCPYVAKGLWREEIIYAKFMLDQIVRAQLMKILDWYVGVNTQFSRSPGKLGKHFRVLLEPEMWALLEKTYADAGYENTWNALFTTCELFERTAKQVAAHFGFVYPHGDAERVTTHLKHVQLLSKDAKEIYSNRE